MHGTNKAQNKLYSESYETKRTTIQKKIALWFVGLLVAYMLIATALYFLMGQQLYYRPSDGEFSLEQEFNCVQAPTNRGMCFTSVSPRPFSVCKKFV